MKSIIIDNSDQHWNTFLNLNFNQHKRHNFRINSNPNFPASNQLNCLPAGEKAADPIEASLEQNWTTFYSFQHQLPCKTFMFTRSAKKIVFVCFLHKKVRRFFFRCSLLLSNCWNNNLFLYLLTSRSSRAKAEKKSLIFFFVLQLQKQRNPRTESAQQRHLKSHWATKAQSAPLIESSSRQACS